MNSFGFLDGISQPAIKGFNKNPLPGQPVVDQNYILFGYDQKPLEPQAQWIKDGSFMCYRQLKQFVPEWNKFIVKAATEIAGHPVGNEEATLLA
jgi:deferrochelatase/peroxidase EfeB